MGNAHADPSILERAPFDAETHRLRGRASEAYVALAEAADSWVSASWFAQPVEWESLFTEHVPLGDQSLLELIRGVQEYEVHPPHYVAERFIWVEEAPSKADVQPDLARRFGELAAQWRDETFGSSMIQDIVMHPAYQHIIGMGPAALPLLLREMRDSHDYWFWALTAIAGRDVADGAEDEDDARTRWLQWGRDQGYVRPGE
jgi:hypothetical protein